MEEGVPEFDGDADDDASGSEEFEFFFGDDPDDDDPFFAEATGMFAVMAAAGQLLKSKLRSISFFAVSVVFLLCMVLILSTDLKDGWQAYFVGPLFAAALSAAAVGVVYFYRSTQWSKVLLAVNSGDPILRFSAFRVLGDTFASEDGEKFVPPLSGDNPLVFSKRERALERKQRELDAIGMAIDAYTAAAAQAKLADDIRSCQLVLYTILDMIEALQKPALSPIFPAEQMEHLEVAICLYLVSLDEERRNGREVSVTLYDFEQMDERSGGDKYGNGELFRRAARVLARKNEIEFAVTCYKKSGWWFKKESNFPEYASSCIDGGFIAALENDIPEAEDLLDAARPHLPYCPSGTARRWWVLDAIIADAYDDDERCRLATANAEFLSENSESPESQR